jgi:hypothetical protein
MPPRGSKGSSKLHLSATRIRLFRECPRKWAWQYIFGHEQPETVALKQGTWSHLALECISQGLPVPEEVPEDLAKRVEASLPYFHTTDTLRPEYSFELDLSEFDEDFAGYTVTGTADRWHTCGILEDLKTTADLRYAKTEEQLRDDPQVQLYAYALFRELPDDQDEMQCRWVYVPKKGKKPPKQVDFTINREWAEKKFEGLLTSMKAMISLYQEVKDAAKVTGNRSMCSRYGGCPFKPHCEPIWRANEEDINDILFRWKKGQG